MNVAAISGVTSTFASHPVARLQGIGASAAANAAATAQKTAAAQAPNFGPAVQVSLSPAAQSLIASQSTVQTSAAVANNNTAQVTSATQSQASLAMTYQTTAEQVWVQVLSSMGLTEQQLNALPLSQRSADEAKAEAIAQNLMTAQVQAPQGVSQTTEASAISDAVQAVAGI